MKRWGKSPPPAEQSAGHGKPHWVQGQIGNLGAARSEFRASETGFGYRLLRQMTLSSASAEQTKLGLQLFQGLSWVSDRHKLLSKNNRL